ncbi:type II toxin-antitoxin system prevent-host-death family antitoxin [Streptomyces milbemycinicus]|uniref:Type II toxin-antitoxin system prevent-host-death family antitoxin n=1 Tax=Streptomyces milbemycinicus TaxID=476552 RepID=A0ABW8M3V6_9ACTN
MRQNLAVPAHRLVNPARGALAEKAARPLRLALSAAARGRMTGAHWHVLLTAPRTAFGGTHSARARHAYELLEQVVADYLRPALTAAPVAEPSPTTPVAPGGAAPAEPHPHLAPSPASTEPNSAALDPAPVEPGTTPAAEPAPSAEPPAAPGPVAAPPAPPAAAVLADASDAAVPPGTAAAADPAASTPGNAPEARDTPTAPAPAPDAARNDAPAAKPVPSAEPSAAPSPVAVPPAPPATPTVPASTLDAAPPAPPAPPAHEPAVQVSADAPKTGATTITPAAPHPAADSAVAPAPASGPTPTTPAPVPTAPGTLHQARAALPKLIHAAADGKPTPLARDTDHALLTTPRAAAALGWNLTGAPMHGIADARKKLGDLIHHAAQGHPQVLRRHTTPVAVLLPATPDGTPRPATTPATAPAAAPTATPPTGLPPIPLQPQPTPPSVTPPAAPTPATAAPTPTPMPSTTVAGAPSTTSTTTATPTGPAPADQPQHPTPAAAPTPTAAPHTAVTAPTGALPPAPGVPAAATPPTPAGTAAEPHPAPEPARPASDAAPGTPAAPQEAPPPAVAHTAPDTGTPADATATPHPTPAPATTPATPTPTPAAPRAPRRLAPLGQALTTVLTPTTPDDTPTTTPVPRGLPTGIPTLDHALGGLQPGRFYLIAADPGTGGSLIATNAARTTALTHHHPVLYTASGLTRADIAARIVAAHLPVDYRRLRTGQLTPTEHADVTALHHQLTAAAPLYIDDGTDLTPAAIAETATDLPGLALVVVDRLQTADDPRLPLSGPRLTDAAQALAHLARTHHLPVLAALDTTHPDLITALGLDVTLTLTPDPDTTNHIRLTITERDLGTQATLTLYADRAHARLTDPAEFDPYAGIRDLTPEELAAIKPFPTTTDYAGAPHPAPEAPNPPTTAPAPTIPTTPVPEAPTNTAAPDSSAWPPVARPGHPTPAPAATAAAPHPANEPAAATPGDPVQPAQTPPQPAPASSPAATSTPQATPAAAPRRTARPSGTASSGGYAGRDYSYFTSQITRAVDQALTEYGGDVESATEALVKKAVPNAMALFEETRVGSNYEHTVYPELLEFLRKKTKDGADQIWEGRHNWTNTALLDQLNAGILNPVTVDALDTNASFLSAFKTYLPIGALQHDPAGGFDPKRSGIYLLTQRPTWHHPHLPDPIGNRHETGPVLLTDATIRLLIRCARYGLCDEPLIAECWTSGATEGLLEKFRRILTESRTTALAREAAGYADGTVAIEYIKAMYSKFTSTMGESNANLEIRRPEWMHIIRSQAFANLWYKAYKAHESGLTIVRARGTDELHVTGGEWRKIQGQEGGAFEEGRLTTHMKLKNRYTLPRKTAA